MERRFITLTLLIAMNALLAGFADADQLPSLSVMMKDVEVAYYSRSGQLSKTSRNLADQLKKAGGEPSPSLLKQWKEFQQGAKQEQIELQSMQRFIFRNSECKQPVVFPLDEKYQKLYRFQYLGNILRVGDFWVKTGLDRYPDEGLMRATWAKAKIEYQKEKKTLENDDFIKVGEVSSTIRKTKDRDLTVVEVVGRSQRRALQKSRTKEGSVLDQAKQWKERKPDEKAKVIVPK